MSTRTSSAAPALFINQQPRPLGSDAGSEVEITKDELCRWMGDHRGLVFRVREGAVWVTQESDAGDIVIRKGECFQVSKKGTVLVQGLRMQNCVDIILR